MSSLSKAPIGRKPFSLSETDKALDLIAKLLLTVGTKMGDGSPAPHLCASCERQGVHNRFDPSLTHCACVCHEARRFVQEHVPGAAEAAVA